MKASPLFLRYLFAFTFLFSAYTKFVAPGYFEITLMDQGLAPSRIFAAYLSRFFIGLEFVLGVLLLLPFYTRKLLLFSLVLIGGFSLHLIYLWSLGDQENCGCFGEMISMTPLESLLKNALLMGLAFWIYIKVPKVDKAKPMLLFFSLLLIGSMWILLPLPKPQAENFIQFTHFEPIGRVDLAQDEVLVAVFNLDCEHCQAAATELVKLSKNHTLPPIYVLFFKEGSTSVEQFEELTQSHFPFTFIDTSTFFDLIGASPPRLYYLSQGEVIQFWDSDLTQGLLERFPAQ